MSPRPDVAAARAAALRAGLLDAPIFYTRDGNCLLKRNVLRALSAVIRRANTPPVRSTRAGALRRARSRDRRRNPRC